MLEVTRMSGSRDNSVVRSSVRPFAKFCSYRGTLFGATVAGNVHVLQNAGLIVDATQQPTTIDGNIHADHCAFALLEGGVTGGAGAHSANCTG